MQKNITSTIRRMGKNAERMYERKGGRKNEYKNDV